MTKHNIAEQSIIASGCHPSALNTSFGSLIRHFSGCFSRPPTVVKLLLKDQRSLRLRQFDSSVRAEGVKNDYIRTPLP